MLDNRAAALEFLGLPEDRERLTLDQESELARLAARKRLSDEHLALADAIVKGTTAAQAPFFDVLTRLLSALTESAKPEVKSKR